MLDLLLTHSGVITTALFFVLFIAILVWVMLPRNRQSLEKNALIPLKEQE